MRANVTLYGGDERFTRVGGVWGEFKVKSWRKIMHQAADNQESSGAKAQ
jgi:hypothetical protein